MRCNGCDSQVSNDLLFKNVENGIFFAANDMFFDIIVF